MKDESGEKNDGAKHGTIKHNKTETTSKRKERDKTSLQTLVGEKVRERRWPLSTT